MLVLQRKPQQFIRYVVPPSTVEQVIDVVVTEIQGSRVRIGSTCADEISIYRGELEADAVDADEPVEAAV
jgi:sRNA-binding carbon storage regulator CsrA